MKKLITKKYLILSIIILLAGSFFVISSTAKFINNDIKSDTVKIAKWKFTEGTENISILLQADYNVFDNLKEGTIAPGTYGTFDIVLDASGSDIGCSYEIKITPKAGYNLPTGLIVSTESINGTIPYSTNPENMKQTITVAWEWTYGYDVNDLNYDEEDVVGSNNDEQNITTELNVEILGKQLAPVEN